jgi:hypothetical protein
VVDAARFPSLSSYLAALPAGIDSYPECRTKGAIVRSAIDDSDLMGVVDVAPAPIASLLRERPPITAWVPAVHADAIFHMHCDLHARSERAMLDWTYVRSTRASSSKAYRHLLAVAGPRFFLRTGAQLHGLFQQGTHLVVPELEGRRALLVLSHPPHLHSRLNQLSNVALVRALVDLTGGKETHVEMIEQSPTGARYEASWK